MDVQYTMKKVRINKKTIKDFIVNEETRRKIRVSEVESLVRAFSKDDQSMQHFDSAIVVNLVKSKWRVIDGNHRLEAIKEKLEREKDFFIYVWIAEYKDMTIEEERQLFNKWNIGATQTATDFLKVHYPTIPCGELMLDRLPVSVYPTDKKCGIKVFIGGYVMAKNQGKFRLYSAGGIKTVKDFMEITPDDVRRMRAFYLDYKELFGEFHKKNAWYKLSPLGVLMRIWYDNRQSMKRQDMMKYFKKIFIDRGYLWSSYLMYTSREQSKVFYNTVINTLDQLTAKKGFAWRTSKDDIQ